MKKNITSRVSALALALGLGLTSVSAQAGSTQTGNEWTAQKSGIVAGTSLAGAAIAGPVGFVLGAAAGDWLGSGVNKGNAVDNLAEERDKALAELARVQEQLVASQLSAERYQVLALDSLQLNVMFGTAVDVLDMRTQARLASLARLLSEHSQLTVQLTGFSDPRGADEYNMNLSARRAKSVQDYLVNKGVELNRIHSAAYGAQYSEASQNDLDAYAMERVVTIQIQEEKDALAAGH